MLKFPKGFMWGSAVSALQTEGYGTTKKGKSVWNVLYDQNPGAFYGQASPDQGVDSMRHYKEDLALMVQYGHNSFRNGFSWCRLFPDGKKVNKEAVQYYHDFLDEAKRLGLTRVMTIQHFEMPQWVQEKGGYASDEFPALFNKYCDFVFAEFGSDVDIFAVYNEPNIEVVYGYLGKHFPPKLADNKLAVKAWRNVVLSHALACVNFDKKYRSKCHAKTAAVHAVSVFVPTDGKKFTNEDEQAAEYMNALVNYSFLDAMLLGRIAPEYQALLAKFKLSHGMTRADMALLAKVKVDYLGMNYYAVQRVKASTEPAKDQRLVNDVYEPYAWEKARINPFRGWEIYPQGLGIVADWVKNRYNNIPYWISENGMAVQEEWKFLDKDGTVQDDYRISYVSEHVAQLHKDIAAGANCVGYHMWSTYDCWSMLNGHKNTYGFFRVDIPTMKRYPKKSAHWYKEVLKNNGFDENFLPVEKTINLKVAVLPSAGANVKTKS